MVGVPARTIENRVRERKNKLDETTSDASGGGRAVRNRGFCAVPDSRREHVGSPPTPPDPATMIANQLAPLTTLLDLTTSQASQAGTIFTNAQSAISTLQTTLNTYQTSLTTAIEGNDTSTIDTLAAEIGTAQGQILDARAKAEALFYAILTATQQAKVQTLGLGILGGGPGGFGGPGPGGPGGPGGPR
jgi:Spy/CpxP family protein refolding chaperone